MRHADILFGTWVAGPLLNPSTSVCILQRGFAAVLQISYDEAGK